MTHSFRVRAVTAGTEGDGYLLFTDVTQLARRRQDLAETVARLERFGRVVSHDLRNPLEVAKIRLEAAQDTVEDVHRQVAHEHGWRVSLASVRGDPDGRRSVVSVGRLDGVSARRITRSDSSYAW